MQGLTERQERVLAEIRKSIRDRGYPPTLREIGEAMGIRSTNGVNDHLRALERKGFLTRTDMASRGITLTEHARSNGGEVADAAGSGVKDRALIVFDTPARARSGQALIEAAIAWHAAGATDDACFDLVVAVEAHLGKAAAIDAVDGARARVLERLRARGDS